MKLVTIFQNEINIGDVIIFSDSDAFMIVKSDTEFSAIQLLNNGNRELGLIDYTDTSIYKLRDRLLHDYGVPKNIVHMKDIYLSL